jgi:hypothetical protein
MNKLLTFIILLLLIGCCGETDLPDNGLKGNVKMLTEYNIIVKFDTLNNAIPDTLSVVKKFYNELNQIIERNQEYSFAEETMDITYEYNRCNRLKKERVKMSFDSVAIDVDYIYKGSLLEKTVSVSSRDSITFEQISLNQYNSDNNLSESSISQLFIDKKTGDTLKNSLQVDKYDENGLVKQSEFKFQENPEKNNRSEYIYSGNDLLKIKEYNQNDLLISTVRFEYKKDSLGNWIERKAFENDTLNAIKTWNIVYK